MDVSFNEKTKTGTRIKFVIVGDKKVGKTTIANHYTQNKIKREYQETIGKEIYKANIIKYEIFIILFNYLRILKF